MNGRPVVCAIRQGKSGEGITTRAAKVIRALLPIRDAIRDVLRAQAADRPWAEAQVRLRVAYSAFIRYFGPINHTVITVTIDPETGEERDSHRRPNLSPFADDPDCWLVASIEGYDVESGLARMGAIFRERVIAPPAAPVIATAADALAVNETGRVDIDHVSELLDRDPDTALAQLGEAVFRSPSTEGWETDDAYLSGAVRTKLAIAAAAAERDPQYARNVAALRLVQPEDLRPSTSPRGSARLDSRRRHRGVRGRGDGHRDDGAPHRRDRLLVRGRRTPFAGTKASGTCEWGTSAAATPGWLLLGRAEQRASPQIWDTWHGGRGGGAPRAEQRGGSRGGEGEAGAARGRRSTGWVLEPSRTRRRRPAGAGSTTTGSTTWCRGASTGGRLTAAGGEQHDPPLRPHQKRVIWRIVSARARPTSPTRSAPANPTPSPARSWSRSGSA